MSCSALFATKEMEAITLAVLVSCVEPLTLAFPSDRCSLTALDWMTPDVTLKHFGTEALKHISPTHKLRFLIMINEREQCLEKTHFLTCRCTHTHTHTHTHTLVDFLEWQIYSGILLSEKPCSYSSVVTNSRSTYMLLHATRVFLFNPW